MSNLNNHYKNLIFTNHAQNRFKTRGISIESIFQTIQNPDHKIKIEQEKIKFFRTLHNRKIQVIAIYKKEEKKWLVISAWVRGEQDKLPLVWQILVLPFKILWWLFKKIVFLLIKCVKR